MTKASLKMSLGLCLPVLLLVSCEKPNPHVPISGGGAAGATAGGSTAPAPLATAALPVVKEAPKAPEAAPKAPEAPVAAPTPKAPEAPVSAPVAAPAAPAAPASGNLKTIKPEFPAPEFAGTPLPADNSIPNLDKSGKPITEIQLPEGVDVISKKAAVTSSDPNPFTGDLTLITDGEKNGADGFYVELQPGLQWVQIDLGAEKEVHGVWCWHFHKQAVIYKGVVVGVSNDPEFKNPTILFNNDFDGSSKMGVGTDLSYTETNHGRWMPAKQGPVKGRYVRLLSNGRGIDEMNHYVEVDVYGK